MKSLNEFTYADLESKSQEINDHRTNNEKDSDFQNISSSQSFIQPNTSINNNVKKKKKIVRNRFTPQEDKEIIRLVSLYGDQNWDKISSELTRTFQKYIKKTPRQCKDRYFNYLSPNINKNEWTLEEDQCLMHNFMLYLPHFKSMKHLFPGRSEVSIKNRFRHLYKFGLNLIKTNINENIQKDKTNSQDGNLNKSLPNNNVNQYLYNYQLNNVPIYSNQVKSIVNSIFNNSPPVLTAVQNNHLILNNKNIRIEQINNNNEINDSNNNNTNNITNNNINIGIFQTESESESLDPLYWFDTFQ